MKQLKGNYYLFLLPKKPNNQQPCFLQGLPEIGPTLGFWLLKNFGSIL